MSGKDQVMDQEAARRSEEEWRHCLLPQAYRVLREHGTERPGSSPLNGEKRAGTYHCAGCGAPRGSPGTSEHRLLEMRSGSIGTTRSGKYTELPRISASRSSAEPGRT